MQKALPTSKTTSQLLILSLRNIMPKALIILRYLKVKNYNTSVNKKKKNYETQLEVNPVTSAKLAK